MSIFIARHGETDANKNRIIQMPNTPLSINGEKQAEFLALRMKELNIDQIICSDYFRAQQTAQKISDQTDIPLEFNPLLRERNFGELRGQSYDDLNFDPFALDYVPVNGESWEVFAKRVSLAWKQVTQIASSHDTNILVVTHGLVCQVLLRQQLANPNNVKSLSNYGNTALTKVTSQPPWTIEFLNCIEHLDEDGVIINNGGRV